MQDLAFERPAAAPDKTLDDSDCIGVFDSGVGGISVLRAMLERLPGESFAYVGDGAHAPYGSRAAGAVIDRSERIVEHLLARGATLVVVACNTASVLALPHLRDRWPTRCFVGVEPGIKPAVARTRTGRIAVMATPATVASGRVAQLIDRHAGGVFVHLQACPGLADAIERSGPDSASVAALLDRDCRRIADANVDTLVLGCTHYPFVATQLRARLGPEVELIDTACAVAERAASLRAVHPTTSERLAKVEVGLGQPSRRQATRCRESGSIRIQVTGATEPMQALIQRYAELSALKVEQLDL
jgi:glutamate racemase